MTIVKTTRRLLRKHTNEQFRSLHRAVTCHRRALPDFLIIGAAKSGTTSLYSYLSQHPDLVPGFPQEIQFFDTDNLASNRFAT